MIGEEIPKGMGVRNLERLPKYVEIDNSMDRLEQVSMDFSMFIESLSSRKITESEDPQPKESLTFAEIYLNLSGKIDELTERFRMHLDMLRDLIT